MSALTTGNVNHNAMRLSLMCLNARGLMNMRGIKGPIINMEPKKAVNHSRVMKIKPPKRLFKIPPMVIIKHALYYGNL